MYAERLEARQLLSADGLVSLADYGTLADYEDHAGASAETSDATSLAPKQEDPADDGTNPPPPPEVPIYNSKPGAPRTIYLDFDGDLRTVQECYYGPTWPFRGCPDIVAKTPIFEVGGDRETDYATFSADEEEAIFQVWQHVAEDFAPFNVNVTTSLAEYNNAYDGSVRVAIGGEWDDWYDEWQREYDPPAEPTSGVHLWTTRNADPNTVWVFAETIETWEGNGYLFRKAVADTASHETGH
ncbi:MAG: hypothetical protein KY475_22625, partial [Planctomycetes bacterium]|nr:hypothetical protein [Planctomycetota bacterium]